MCPACRAYSGTDTGRSGPVHKKTIDNRIIVP